MVESKSDRDRFRELEEQHKVQAERYEEAEQMLCRTIARLCVATSGLDSSLDPHLTNLRKAVRQGYGPEVKSRIDDLADAVVTAGEHRKSPVLFDRFVERLNLAGKQIEQARKLWSRLSLSPSQAEDKELDRLAELLGLTEHDEVTGEHKEGGLLGRLFTKSTGKGKSPNERLLDVLNRLEWPAVMLEEVSEIKKSLASKDNPDAWVGVVERISALVSEALTDAQKEVHVAEQFLSDLTKRLDELDQHMRGESSRRENARESGKRLGEAVKAEVDDISDTVHGASDLEQLRKSVLSSLDRIQGHVDNHLRNEEELRQESEKIEKSLRDNMHSLEKEAYDLRREIAKVRETAMRDQLTGLANRRAYDERIEQEYARWKRFNEPLVLLVWDLDNFKTINDTFGHKAGDKALKVIAKTLREHMRETDFLARYGGEEFVVVLSGASSENAFKVAEVMRKAIENAGLHSNNKPVKLTLSGGLSQFQEGDSIIQVFERADKAMYQAKHQGKNQVVIG